MPCYHSKGHGGVNGGVHESELIPHVVTEKEKKNYK